MTNRIIAVSYHEAQAVGRSWKGRAPKRTLSPVLPAPNSVFPHGIKAFQAMDSVWFGCLWDHFTGPQPRRSYTRDVTLSAAGKPDLEASSDSAFHGDRHRWNPEDLLVAALSQCHLLSYLHAAVVAGVTVVSYTDEATGLMRQDGGNGGAFVEVTLRPQVAVADPATIDAAIAAHHTAHEWCFIANSVNFPAHVRTLDHCVDGGSNSFQVH